MSALRCTPNLETWRPGDAVESAVAWKQALLNKNGPTALIFSRQGLVCQQRTDEQLTLIEKGAYILSDSDATPEVILIATGSELEITMNAAQQLREESIAVRVVSMPCAERFVAQDAGYREAVLPSDVHARVAVEAGHPDFWYKFVGFDGRIIGVSTFGESAPGPELMAHFGFTVENIVQSAKECLA